MTSRSRGAGVRVGPGASEKKLRAAVERALADPGLRAGAERFARVFAGEPGAERAADEIEALAG